MLLQAQAAGGTSHDALSSSACLWLLYYFCHSWFVLATSFCSHLIFCSSGGDNVTHPRNVSSTENAAGLKNMFLKKKSFFLHLHKFLCFFMSVHTTDCIFLFLKTLIINVNLVLSSQQHKHDTKIRHSEDWLRASERHSSGKRCSCWSILIPGSLWSRSFTKCLLPQGVITELPTS